MTNQKYSALASELRAVLAPAVGEPRHALVQAATLAPSSHNTQPWQFHVAGDTIIIAPDLSRRCPVVDPDDSHLFKSLGCAAENLVAAAPSYGFEPDVRIQPDGRIIVGLAKRKASGDAAALKAISERQCTKLPYDGRALATHDSTALEAAGMGEGVRVLLIDDAGRKESILDYVNEPKFIS